MLTSVVLFFYGCRVKWSFNQVLNKFTAAIYNKTHLYYNYDFHACVLK